MTALALAWPGPAQATATYADAQDCVIAGASDTAPTCSDSKFGHDGRLYSVFGGGASAVTAAVGAEAYDVIGEEAVAPFDAHLEASADVSEAAPDVAAGPPVLAPVPVAVSLICVELNDETAHRSTEECHNQLFEWGRSWPALDVAKGDALHVAVSVFPIWGDRVGACVPPFGNCVAAAGGPAAAAGQLNGFRLDFRPRL